MFHLMSLRHSLNFEVRHRFSIDCSLLFLSSTGLGSAILGFRALDAQLCCATARGETGARSFHAWPWSAPRLALVGSTPGFFSTFDVELPSEIRFAPAFLYVDRLPFGIDSPSEIRLPALVASPAPACTHPVAGRARARTQTHTNTHTQAHTNTHTQTHTQTNKHTQTQTTHTSTRAHTHTHAHSHTQ